MRLFSLLTQEVAVRVRLWTIYSDALCIALRDVHGELVAVRELGGSSRPQNHLRHVPEICTWAQKGHNIRYTSVLPSIFPHACPHYSQSHCNPKQGIYVRRKKTFTPIKNFKSSVNLTFMFLECGRQLEYVRIPKLFQRILHSTMTLCTFH